MGTNMKDMSSPGTVVKSGLQTFKRLEALQILPLPICLRNGKIVDVEHASNAEFTDWVRWNEIPFIGSEIWSFDSKCGIINHALRFGFKLRLIASPGNVFGMSSECLLNVFEWPKSSSHAD